jgi:hypothetical protein
VDPKADAAMTGSRCYVKPRSAWKDNENFVKISISNGKRINADVR